MRMNIEVKATIDHWVAIELLTDDGKTAEMVMYGIPSHATDEFVLTSPVQRIEQESNNSVLITTKNSVYRAVGKGKHFKLPFSAIPELQEGIDPAVIVTRYERPRVDVKEALARRKRYKVGDRRKELP